jgi:hypothetical protein
MPTSSPSPASLLLAKDSWSYYDLHQSDHGEAQDPRSCKAFPSLPCVCEAHDPCPPRLLLVQALSPPASSIISCISTWYEPGPQNLPCTPGAIEVSTLRSCYIVVSELTIATMILLQLDLLMARKCWRKSMLFGEVKSDIGEFMQTCGSKRCSLHATTQKVPLNKSSETFSCT